MLVICETHPVPYHAPVYQVLVRELGVPLHVLYGSNFSTRGYFDREFCSRFSWNSSVLDGYSHSFVRTVEEGGAVDYDTLSGAGVRTALQALSPSMVLALGYHHRFDRAVIYSALADGTPLLFRGETTDTALERTMVRSMLRDAVLRRLYQRCAALLHVGKNSLLHYQRLGVSNARLFYSPYCVEATAFECSAQDRATMREASRQRLGIDEDAIVVLFSGKLSTRKGADLLPVAVRLLPPALRNRIHLLFLGEGVLAEQLKAACQQGPRIAATFAGFQHQSALSHFYHAADMLVLPSRTMETWGLVVNEALLHGLPCVVSEAVGSQPDLVIPGKTGAVFKNSDPSALAAALVSVMERLGEPGLAETCRQQVKGFSVHAAAEGILRATQFIENNKFAAARKPGAKASPPP